MLQAGQGPGLALEAGLPLRIAMEFGREDLEGHVPAQLGVPRTEHFAHAALADRLDDFVVQELLADHGTAFGQVTWDFQDGIYPNLEGLPAQPGGRTQFPGRRNRGGVPFRKPRLRRNRDRKRS